MMPLKLSLAFLLLSGLSCAVPPASKGEQALSCLETWDFRKTTVELQQASDVIRDSYPKGDTRLWARLRALITNEERPTIVRTRALTLACEKADEKIASAIIELAKTWAATVETEIAARAERKRIHPDAVMLMRLLENGVVHLEGVLADQQPLLQILTTIASWPRPGNPFPGMGPRAAMAVGSSPAPFSDRQACALKIIEHQPRSIGVPPGIVPLLDETMWPRLRALVRESRDPDTFSLCAAAALAHMGDRDILPLLQALRAPFLEKHPALETYLVGYIWKIENQHPPSRLLEYIASAPRLERGANRKWAMARAVELGIPKDQVRAAVLAHARQVKPEGKYKIRPGLLGVKRQGLNLGVLTEEDLPDIKLPAVHPTP